MTGPDGQHLAAAEPYTRTFEATVTAVEGTTLGLDRTYFYPEGGGQPPDEGTIAGIEVTDVQSRDGTTVHTLAETPPVAEGDVVEGRIDDAFRTYSMRAHTASHVVYGVGRRLFDDHGYGGFDIGAESVRLDFETGAAADSVNALTIQRMANEAVWAGRDVSWYEMDAGRARADDDVVFNLDPEATGETVRIVEVEGWDVSACGGTHVRNTIEVGPVQVLEVSNPGADLVRVEYAVGERAIDHWIDERRSAARAAAALDTNVADLPRQVEGLQEETRSLRARVEALGEELLEARLAALAAEGVSVDGEEWIVGTVPEVGPNAVADALGDAHPGAADVVALAGRDGSTFVVVASAGETDASAVVSAVTEEFGGGGGGRPTLAQGGGIGADPSAVVEFLRDS